MMHRESYFEAAALPFLDGLYRTAFRMVHDERTAERCVEHAFIEASNSFHHLPQVNGLRARLFTILFQSLHNRRKAWFHIKGWLTHSPGQQELAEAAECGESADQDGAMLQALDSIPGILREVLLLVDVEGFNRCDVQGILGIPAEVVASRLEEGRRRLRTRLNGGGRMNPPLAEDAALA